MIVPLILTGVLLASPAVQMTQKPAGWTAAEQKQVAGVIITLNIVENRLIRELAIGRPEFKAHITSALGILEKLGTPLLGSVPNCQPGSCPDDGTCVPCYPWDPRLILLNRYLRFVETRILDGPAFRQHSKEVIATTQNLVNLMGGAKALSGVGHCPEGGILVACK